MPKSIATFSLSWEDKILANNSAIVALGRWFLIDATIPHDEGLVKDESEKRRKYLPTPGSPDY